jgi:hypothetical protein
MSIPIQNSQFTKMVAIADTESSSTVKPVTNKKVRKITLTIKKKNVDPAKINAVHALQKITFTKVEDRFLMDEDTISKEDSLRPFIGFDNPTTCQINLNYLYCKAIACMDKRMKAVEKLNSVNENDTDNNMTGKKRKRETKKKIDASTQVEVVNLEAEVTRDIFQTDENKDKVHTPVEEKEPGEVTMDDAQ